MKKLMMLFVLMANLANAQTFSEVIKKESAFEVKNEQNTVVVANLNGEVRVEGYDGDKVLVEATKKVYGKTTERLELGKREIQLGFIDRGDTLIYYVDGICQSFGKNQRQKVKWNKTEWSYNWYNCDNHETPYDFEVDFLIKVPKGVHVMVSTINEGDVVVKNVKGKVNAHNINGSIRLDQLERESIASTINGDVDIEFIKNPASDCRFYSLNGDINAWFQKGLAANMTFESYNGDLFTNIEELESLPMELKKESTRNGTRYKVNGSAYKIRKGGAMLDFETFNGNVYLKEK